MEKSRMIQLTTMIPKKDLGESYPELLPVDAMFAKIQEAIDNQAQEIVVEYDPYMWFPRSIWIDQSYQMADEEQSYTYEVTVG